MNTWDKSPPRGLKPPAGMNLAHLDLIITVCQPATQILRMQPRQRRAIELNPKPGRVCNRDTAILNRRSQ